MTETTGKIVAYIRVSSSSQNSDRQLDGIEIDKRFTDKISGKSLDRPQLKAMLEYVREGDRVMVHSLDRLARNLQDLLHLVKKLTEQGITVEFVKESLVFTGEDSPMAMFLLSVIGSVAQFERALIEERQREGIELAKKKGAYKGRKPALNKSQVAELKNRVDNGERKTDIAKHFCVHRDTVYQYLRT